MAKRNERKHKISAATRQGKSVANAPSRASATKVAVKTVDNRPSAKPQKQESAQKPLQSKPVASIPSQASVAVQAGDEKPSTEPRPQKPTQSTPTASVPSQARAAVQTIDDQPSTEPRPRKPAQSTPVTSVPSQARATAQAIDDQPSPEPRLQKLTQSPPAANIPPQVRATAQAIDDQPPTEPRPRKPAQSTPATNVPSQARAAVQTGDNKPSPEPRPQKPAQSTPATSIPSRARAAVQTMDNKPSPEPRPQKPAQSTPATSVPSQARAAVQTGDNKPSPEPRPQKPVQKHLRRIQRRQLLIGGLGVAATAAGLGHWLLAEAPHANPPQEHNKDQRDQLVIQWNNVILQAIRTLQPSMPVAARALAMVHTSMFDAWAAYDSVAVGTQLGNRLKRTATANTLADQAQAISYAAYRTLVDLFPSEKQRFEQMMTSLTYNPADQGMNASTPAGVGNLAAQAVLDFRHADRSNQLGTIAHGAYVDFTHYKPVNTPDEIKDPNHWQPLRLPNPKHPATFIVQQFSDAQWGNVTPFALTSVSTLLPVPGPPLTSSTTYTDQARQILQYSADLTDEQKVIAEYWMNGPNQEQPPGHWNLLAQMISQRIGYNLGQNIKLFFALTNALLDASIACWATKRAYDSPYPLTAIHYLFQGKQVQAWAGPGKGKQMIDGAYWQPYQPSTLIAPSFPEYCSEQSVFSSAAAEILRRFTGSDHMELAYTQLAHHSLVESGTPATNITLAWSTFTQAENQAGLAARYSGTHFTQSDLTGRTMGRAVSAQVWLKAQEYITGNIQSS